MKKVLVTQRICRHEAYNEIFDRLDTQWAQLLNNAGLLPVPLPSGYDTDTFLDETAVDGILLTGGNNLSCVQDDELSVRRDAMEKKVLTFALDNDVPVLGVCRGMQFIAHYFDASLAPVKNHTAVKHDCTALDTSRFYNYFSQCRQVNSYHDYAVKDISSPLSVVAMSGDGTIEALEHQSKRIVGFMWHPEREDTFLERDITFFHDFFYAL